MNLTRQSTRTSLPREVQLRGMGILRGRDDRWVWGFEAVGHEIGVEAVIKETRKHLGDKPVYLTFDIDCLDPSYAPGTGTPVCGGLTSHQAMSILRGLGGINLVGMDIVEVAPAYDVAEITSLAAGHLAMEMLYLYSCK